MLHKNLLIRQTTFFIAVGVATLVIDVSVTAGAYYFFHQPAYVASGIGFLSGFFFNFPMNRKKVFRHTINDRFTLWQQIGMVACLSVFNLVFTSLMVEIVVNLERINIEYAKLIGTAIIAVWNFIIFKWFIFSKRI